LQEELIDRFGELPIQAQSPARHAPPAFAGQTAAVSRSWTPSNDQVTIQFSPEFSKNPPIEPIKIINLIQKNRSYKLAGQDKLSFLRH
jgi:transcription-repair coupling factor (superfamily II helicase)